LLGDLALYPRSSSSGDRTRPVASTAPTPTAVPATCSDIVTEALTEDAAGTDSAFYKAARTIRIVQRSPGHKRASPQ
jgi:hypothetical protein